MLFVFVFQMYSGNLYFYYYRCQSPHRGAPWDWRSYRETSRTTTCAPSTYFTPTPHSICLAHPSVTQTCGQWFRCVFYGHTGKVWRLQTKPQPCQAYEGRRGPFWGSHHRVQITGPSPPGARCQANDRWSQSQMPAPTGQWWTKRGKYRDREGVIPAMAGMTVGQREGGREVV